MHTYTYSNIWSIKLLYFCPPHIQTIPPLESGEVDKRTQIYVFCRFSLSAFMIVYKAAFISECLTAFDACSSITRSVLETRTMRSSSFVFLGYAGLMSWRISSLLHFLILLIWSFDHWLPRGIEIMLYWFRCRFYWRAMSDSHRLSKFFGMYWFLHYTVPCIH